MGEWFTLIRQLCEMLLGIAVIVFAVTSPGHDATFIICGLILLGLVPIDALLTRFARDPRR